MNTTDIKEDFYHQLFAKMTRSRSLTEAQTYYFELEINLPEKIWPFLQILNHFVCNLYTEPNF